MSLLNFTRNNFCEGAHVCTMSFINAMVPRIQYYSAFVNSDSCFCCLLQIIHLILHIKYM